MQIEFPNAIAPSFSILFYLIFKILFSNCNIIYIKFNYNSFNYYLLANELLNDITPSFFILLLLIIFVNKMLIIFNRKLNLPDI